MPLAGGVQVNEGSAGAAMAHPVHQFPEPGPRVGCELVSGMAQIMKVDLMQPNGFAGFNPTTIRIALLALI